MAVSTRNSDHIMVAANDYRTVDIADDIGIGDVFTRLARGIASFAERVVARLTGRGELESEEEEREKVEAGTAPAPSLRQWRR